MRPTLISLPYQRSNLQTSLLPSTIGLVADCAERKLFRAAGLNAYCSVHSQISLRT